MRYGCGHPVRHGCWLSAAGSWRAPDNGDGELETRGKGVLAYIGSCYWKKLRLVTSAVEKRYAAALRPVGLSIGQYCILANIDRLDRPTTSALACAIEVDRTTLVRTLKPLEQGALVCDLSENGARDRRLCLSEKGKEILECARASWRRTQEDVEALFGKEAIVQLEHMVEVVHATQGD